MAASYLVAAWHREVTSGTSGARFCGDHCSWTLTLMGLDHPHGPCSWVRPPPSSSALRLLCLHDHRLPHSLVCPIVSRQLPTAVGLSERKPEWIRSLSSQATAVSAMLWVGCTSLIPDPFMSYPAGLTRRGPRPLGTGRTGSRPRYTPFWLCDLEQALSFCLSLLICKIGLMVPTS